MRSQQWALRCVHEASLYEENSFVTLTYDDAHLPAGRSLDVRDWQLFAKRFRKARGPFRFFLAGEYGDQLGRPHFHALMFGVGFDDQVLVKRNERGEPIYRSLELESIWKKGAAPFGAVTYESAAYVARYACKKVTGEKAAEHYELVDPLTGEVFQRRPEFATMSRGGRTGRGGIGQGWFEKYGGDVFPADSVVHDGRHHRPPRFYEERLDPEVLAPIKARRVRAALARGEELTDERRLKVRETVAEAALNLKGRTL